MSRYEALKVVHVLAATLWVGAGIGLQIQAAYARRLGRDALLTMGEIAEGFGERILIPTSLLALLTGIGMTFDSPYGFGDAWILIGLAGFATSFGMGVGVVGPIFNRVAELRAAGDLDAVHAQLWRFFVALRVELVVLVIVVVDMVIKPGA